MFAYIKATTHSPLILIAAFKAFKLKEKQKAKNKHRNSLKKTTKTKKKTTHLINILHISCIYSK